MQSTKRSAEDFARTNHASKKPRFDLRNPSALAPSADPDEEEDAVLAADVIGSKGQQVRRNAVNIDGYDSDSDNENFDDRAAAKAKAKEEAEKKSKDEDENDMFADLEEDFTDGDDPEGDTARRGEGRKKAVRFLQEDEIEGQVKNSKSGGHVSADFSLNGKSKSKGKTAAVDEEQESSSDSEVDDATRADAGDVDEELGAGSKKNHAPKLDAFNMRSENVEGAFDESGNYVRRAVDPDEKHDVWMEGISKKEMKKASEAREKRERERRVKAIEDDAKSDGDILASLLPQLQPAETVLEALARLNKGKTKKPKWQISKKKKKKQKRKDDMALDGGGDEVDDPKEKERSNAIEIITEAADLLLARGQPEVYDTEKELLMRQYHRITGEEWEEPSDVNDSRNASNNSDITTDKWQYRWSDARDGGGVHGPYDGRTMKVWSDAGYFGDAVEFQKIGVSEWGWTRVADFV